MASFCMKVLLCTLGLTTLGLSAAVESVQEHDTEARSYCNLHYTVQAGDTCWDICNNYGYAFTIKQLLCWNPEINTSCTNLIPGRSVCVGVRGAGPKC
ncbi:hypothetical protein N7539_006743 [Penicillium diatomitis]|uniref:LysM domain-containing protein n=1 Tax=Penicillium diatomitis TaxID=2819901 RepID=A0A9W9X1R6_9EURO|nr:uncharacterized protein N7539_006743 [Penicillium diatomitis]KAJ5480849.1 hypothetical protein N7539_006743 [Penicillium diatomitis]